MTSVTLEIISRLTARSFQRIFQRAHPVVKRTRLTTSHQGEIRITRTFYFTSGNRTPIMSRRDSVPVTIMPITCSSVCDVFKLLGILSQVSDVNTVELSSHGSEVWHYHVRYIYTGYQSRLVNGNQRFFSHTFIWLFCNTKLVRVCERDRGYVLVCVRRPNHIIYIYTSACKV